MITRGRIQDARRMERAAAGRCYDCGRAATTFRCEACRVRVNEYRREHPPARKEK